MDRHFLFHCHHGFATATAAGTESEHRLQQILHRSKYMTRFSQATYLNVLTVMAWHFSDGQIRRKLTLRSFSVFVTNSHKTRSVDNFTGEAYSEVSFYISVSLVICCQDIVVIGTNQRKVLYGEVP